MRSIESWLNEYSHSHQNVFNQVTHWLCVPAITLSVLGLLWGLPVPVMITSISPVLNWALLFVVAALVFYGLLSMQLALGMAIITGLMLGLVYLLDSLPPPLWQVSLVIFVIAWVGQFIGHLVEGAKPSFFKDLQFLLIGPVWLLAKLYRRLGIKY